MLTRIYEIHFVSRKFDTVKKQLLHVPSWKNSIDSSIFNYNHKRSFLPVLYSGDYVNYFSSSKLPLKYGGQSRLAFSNFFYASLANI